MADNIVTVSPCDACADGAFCVDWHCIHHPDHPDNDNK